MATHSPQPFPPHPLPFSDAPANRFFFHGRSSQFFPCFRGQAGRFPNKWSTHFLCFVFFFSLDRPPSPIRPVLLRGYGFLQTPFPLFSVDPHFTDLRRPDGGHPAFFFGQRTQRALVERPFPTFLVFFLQLTLSTNLWLRKKLFFLRANGAFPQPTFLLPPFLTVRAYQASTAHFVC